MQLWFLPFVHEGLAATAIANARPQAPIALRLESPGRATRDISRAMPLLGPGDVVAIEPRQVLRVTPAAGTGDAEPDFFPAIEFDAPDLPWAYSPVVADQVRVLPWMILAVIEATPDVSIAAGERGQSPYILRMPEAVARRELPELTDTWAWAHAQVACDTVGEVASTLAGHPDRTLSRLIAARRLLPFRGYVACVVPAFLTGVIAGLGGDPSTDPLVVTGQEPAWTPSRVPAALPVYYTWTFRTGEAGDFESLAQRLRAAPLDASVTPTPLHLSLPEGDRQLTVDWEAPLHVPGATPTKPPRPAEAVTQLGRALEPGTPARPVLGPAYYGSPWVDERGVTPLTHWNAELNATPMLRAAAGLAADAVRADQDALVTAASEQLDAFRARQRVGRRQQLAATVVNRVKRRLANAPQAQVARVFAPMAVTSQFAASNVGLYTAAGRRIVRKVSVVTGGAHAGGGAAAPLGDATLATRADPLTATPITTAGLATPTVTGTFTTPHTPATDTSLEATSADITSTPGSGAELAPVLIPAVEYHPLVPRIPVAEPPPPIAPVDAPAIPTGGFTPRFARPMSEALAERHPELMLPGAGSIDANGVLVVESNPAFVEAFLVGANQELNYELLWRGLPSDLRATAFRRFWGHAGDVDDIGDIGSWDGATAVGSHVMAGASMILLVRSELVRRYPGVLVAAVPGEWNGGTLPRTPVKDPSRVVLPAFRGRIGSDVLYAGFAQPSITAAIGANTPAGDAGWFFLLSENPGDPRFGLDPDAESATPTRATLAWTHLQLPDGARYATVASFPPVADAIFPPANVSFTPANATAASIATLTRQRPFRAFLHASLLVRPSA
jgi:hypothetical protein